MTIRVLRAGDEQVLARVAPDVFDHPIDPALTAEFLADPRHHRAVAIDDDDGVVVALAQLWISEVAVAPTHQRRGLGTAVMRAVLEVGRQLRCTEAWVLTDRGNAAATGLYAALGGREGADEGPADATLGFTFA